MRLGTDSGTAVFLRLLLVVPVNFEKMKSSLKQLPFESTLVRYPKVSWSSC